MNCFLLRVLSCFSPRVLSCFWPRGLPRVFSCFFRTLLLVLNLNLVNSIHRTKATIKNLFLDVFIFTKLVPIDHRRRKWARWPFGPPGPKSSGPAQSIQGPLRSRHASRWEFMQGFMCISACGRVAGLAGRFIDLHGSRTLGMCRVAGWIRRLCN